jgi:UDP-N-acetylmuramoylalanine--D-glutamate ligase
MEGTHHCHPVLDYCICAGVDWAFNAEAEVRPDVFPASSFKGKTVAVFGLARSGISCALALKAGGANVLAWDDSDPAVEMGRTEGLPIANLHNVDFHKVDTLVLSPGVPLTHPEPHWSVTKARAAGTEVIGDTEVFAREVVGSGARTVAITGTNGKSTTTALIGHILRSAGLDAEVGGNIGLAVFNLSAPKQGRVYVLELSSFQIDLMPGLKPDVGVLTNITPDHLDRHGTIENYAAVKARMFALQAKADTSVICVDDEWCSAIADRQVDKSDLKRVSVFDELSDGVSAPEGLLRERENGSVVTEIDLRNMRALQGRHNWQNACVAYCSARALGLSRDQIESGMRSFGGLAHRMQEVAWLGQVRFVNDSKATNADAAEKALSTFDNIYWIAGGIAKSGGIEPLRPYFKRMSKAYLIGVAADEFAKVLDGEVAFEKSETLDKAVTHAARDAARDAKSDPVVLLSPACASFDQYKNFEVRGEAFVAEVAKLPDVVMTGGSG